MLCIHGRLRENCQTWEMANFKSMVKAKVQTRFAYVGYSGVK